MSRKKPKIAMRLQRRAASKAPPPDCLVAARTLLEDCKAIDDDWRRLSPDDVVRRHDLYWALLAAFQCYLASQGQESPALDDFIDALLNTVGGVATEDRLAPPHRFGNALTVKEEYARAQVIAAVNSASAERKQEAIKAGAKYLGWTSKQIIDLVKNHDRGAYSRTLCNMVKEMEFHISIGHGPELDQLRKARLLG